MSTDSQTDKTSAAEVEDARFQTIVTQRYMYNAEACKELPLVGHLLNLLNMPPFMRKEGPRHWNAFLIKTTRPTKALDRDKNVVDVAAGSEVLIPATHELSQFLTKAATSPDKVYEVKIKPKSKLDLGGGQEMWLYEMGAVPQPTKRSIHGLAGVLAPLQLPPAGDSSGDGATDSDTPW